MKKLALAAVAMVSTLSFATAISSSWAETKNCTEITALPFTITVQGIYCLKQNLNVNLATGNAITINAGNVTIDFNGWRVNNQAAATNGATGVYALDRKNITLRDGFIRGFKNGITFFELTPDASAAHLIEGMKVADGSRFGIVATGEGTVVRGNKVSNIGSSTENTSRGIVLQEANNGVVSGNIISGISNQNFSVGIYTNVSDRVHVLNNYISNVSGAFDVHGIYFSGNDSSTFASNTIVNDAGGGNTGILSEGDPRGSCLNNDIGGYTTAVSGCDFEDGNRELFN